MSSFSEPGRSDARRNRERLLAAASEVIAEKPAAGLGEIAARAGVSRATLYHHFASRDALLDALTEQSIREVGAALEAAQTAAGSAAEAMTRALLATWQVIGRYRGLVLVNPERLGRAELRARMAPAVRPLLELLERGRAAGEFDPELPSDWLFGVITDLIHAASRAVSAGTLDPALAERVMLRSAHAVLTSHQPVRSRTPGPRE